MALVPGLKLVNRAWILFFLFLMVVSAGGVLTASAGSAYIYLATFLAAVAGLDTASIAVSLKSAASSKAQAVTAKDHRATD